MPVVERLSIGPFQRVANGYAPEYLHDKLKSLVVDRVGVVVTNSAFNVDDKDGAMTKTFGDVRGGEVMVLAVLGFGDAPDALLSKTPSLVCAAVDYASRGCIKVYRQSHFLRMWEASVADVEACGGDREAARRAAVRSDIDQSEPGAVRYDDKKLLEAALQCSREHEEMILRVYSDKGVGWPAKLWSSSGYFRANSSVDQPSLAGWLRRKDGPRSATKPLLLTAAEKFKASAGVRARSAAGAEARTPQRASPALLGRSSPCSVSSGESEVSNLSSNRIVAIVNTTGCGAKVAKCLMAVGINEHMLGTDSVVFEEVLEEVSAYLEGKNKAPLGKYEVADLRRVCQPLDLRSPALASPACMDADSPPLGLQAPLLPQQTVGWAQAGQAKPQVVAPVAQAPSVAAAGGGVGGRGGGGGGRGGGGGGGGRGAAAGVNSPPFQQPCALDGCTAFAQFAVKGGKHVRVSPFCCLAHEAAAHARLEEEGRRTEAARVAASMQVQAAEATARIAEAAMLQARAAATAAATGGAQPRAEPEGAKCELQGCMVRVGGPLTVGTFCCAEHADAAKRGRLYYYEQRFTQLGLPLPPTGSQPIVFYQEALAAHESAGVLLCDVAAPRRPAPPPQPAPSPPATLQELPVPAQIAQMRAALEHGGAPSAVTAPPRAMSVSYWREMCEAYGVEHGLWLRGGTSATAPQPVSPVPMGLPISPGAGQARPEPSRRALACVAQLQLAANPDVAAAFEQVPSERMEEVMRALASLLGQQVLVSEQVWTAEVVVPVVVGRLAMRLSTSGRSMADMMAAKLAANPLGDGVARLMAVVDELPVVARGNPSSSADTAKQAEQSEQHSLIWSALERLGANPEAAKAVSACCDSTLASAGDATQQASVLVERARGLEMGVFGADVAAILHQENLAAPPTGTHALSVPARAVLLAFDTLRPRLWKARALLIEKSVPLGVSGVALVKAATHGLLTVHMVAGVAATASDEEVMEGVARCMPMLVDLVRVVTPRDGAAAQELLELWRTASAAAMPKARGRAKLTALFEAYAMRAAEHSTGAHVHGPLTWEAVRAYERDERIANFDGGSTSGGGASTDAAALQAAAEAAVEAHEKAKTERNRLQAIERKAAKAAKAAAP